MSQVINMKLRIQGASMAKLHVDKSIRQVRLEQCQEKEGKGHRKGKTSAPSNNGHWCTLLVKCLTLEAKGLNEKKHMILRRGSFGKRRITRMMLAASSLVEKFLAPFGPCIDSLSFFEEHKENHDSSIYRLYMVDVMKVENISYAKC